MTKILSMIILYMFFQTSLYAGVTTGYKLGKGPLKLTKHMVNELEFFFSGGTKGAYAEKQKSAWKPGLIAISVDGNTSYMFRHPLHVTQVDSKAYWQTAIKNCKKKSGQECYLFANGYKTPVKDTKQDLKNIKTSALDKDGWSTFNFSRALDTLDAK